MINKTKEFKLKRHNYEDWIVAEANIYPAMNLKAFHIKNSKTAEGVYHLAQIRTHSRSDGKPYLLQTLILSRGAEIFGIAKFFGQLRTFKQEVIKACSMKRAITNATIELAGTIEGKFLRVPVILGDVGYGQISTMFVNDEDLLKFNAIEPLEIKRLLEHAAIVGALEQGF